METINTLLKILAIVLLTYFALTVLYMFVYSVLGSLFVFKPKKSFIKNTKELPRIALLIPAYKEDAVIISTVESALRQNYPIGKYQITVIADQLQTSTLYKLKQMPINLVEVFFEKSTKAKAINAALNSLPNSFDNVVILDADNIMEKDFLHKLAKEFLQGHQALQGHRTAKNKNTPIAVLDAISEEINNTIFCKGPQLIGLSSRLIGSGMGFNYVLFKDIMKDIKAVGGFDKELEIKLLEQQIKIKYVENAVIYDEKVSYSDVIVKQRTRWISSQFYFMRKYFLSGIGEFLHYGNFDYFNKTIQLIILPRVYMLVGLKIAVIFALIDGNPAIKYSTVTLLAIYIFSFVIASPKRLLKRNAHKLIVLVPLLMYKTIKSFPSILSANKTFIHTPHNS
jgi:cellulose synthase/poly-beta-1,6-N-acetylglucosamine synthase-like glycosyltransferase